MNREQQGPPRQQWRSLEELEGLEPRPEPRAQPSTVDALDRREYLRLMGASLGLAGLAGCTRQPVERIVPYVRPPEEMLPGKPLYYATAVTLGGLATGVLVESHMGRPTKIEGNPEHPASLGATDAITQASILTLYDPDRAQVVSHTGRISTWDALVAALGQALAAEAERSGAGLRILTETVTSPTLTAQLRALLKRFPAARWHQYDPVTRDHARAGARLAFGRYLDTHYRFDKADVVLSLEADFLFAGPGAVRYARDFIAGRRLRDGRAEMNRLYLAESTPSTTGAVADHRAALRPGEIDMFARAVAAGLGVTAAAGASSSVPWLQAVIRDLEQHRGSSVVLAGDCQPPQVHALAHAINHALVNIGRTVVHTEPVETEPAAQIESLRELVADMKAGRVELLIILGSNPVYTAPSDLGFAEHLDRVKLRVDLGLYDDETSRLCHWHIPETHYLEAWGDARAFEGTVTIQQPLIAPLYGGKSAHEVLSALLGQPDRTGYDIVREYWRSRRPGAGFEQFWQQALHDGVVAGSAAPAVTPSMQTFSLPPAAGGEGLELLFRPDPTVWDGRFAGNAWLQELPKPLTKLTWDNVVLVSPATARRRSVSSEDVVELHYRGLSAHGPVWVMPGQADDTVTVTLGYGRTRAGRIGTGVGFNAYALRTWDAPWSGAGLELRKTGEQYKLACTQGHHSTEGRDLVHHAKLAAWQKDPQSVHGAEHHPAGLSLYPEYKYEGHAWGMAIDLNACVGCGACTAACQAENNIPSVGKTEVLRGREMHWIRVDRYYEGPPETPATHFQPVPCMHCENAPCEVVCPVGATSHSREGLNEMTYNRCVGTKYCSNNCPYKVRRFNFLPYTDYTTPSLKLLNNPDVTVRSRGVMEKCTYCVQRINAARIEAKKQDRSIRDGEVVTACQAVCPAEAIVFGDLNDPQSRVARWKKEQRNYVLLAELNTRPRTSYLARLQNPNPEAE